MFLLDNNILKLFLDGNANVVRQVAQNTGGVWLSSVAAEEYLVVYMGTINRVRAPRTSLSLPHAHTDFVKAIRDVNVLPIWAY